MSLITEMMHDLEERSKSNEKKPEVEIPIFDTAADKKSRNNWFYFARISFFIVVLGLLTYALLNSIFDFHPTFLKITQNQIESPKNNSLLTNPAPVTSNLLTGITFKTEKNITYLRLLLNKSPLYRLAIDNQHKRIIVVLDQTRLLSDFSQLDYSNSAIKNLEMINQANGDLKVILTLNSNADIKHIGMKEKGKSPAFQVELYNHEKNVPANKDQALPVVPKTEDVAISSGNTNSVETQPVSQNAQIEIPAIETMKIAETREPVKPIVTPKKNVSNLLKHLKISKVDSKQLKSSTRYEYLRALNYSSLGKTKKSIQLLKNIIKNNPEYMPARAYCAALLFQQGDKKKADQLLVVGLKQQPNYIPFVELHARILADAGETQQALKLLKGVKPLPKLLDEPDYHAFIAALYQRLGEPKKSADLYQKLLTLNPNKAAWWIGLGIALDSIGEKSSAINAFTKASNSVELTPELKKYVAAQIRNHA